MKTSHPSRSEVIEARGPLNRLIGRRMRELGIKNIEEFARHAGVSRSNLYELIRGRSPSAPSAWKTPSLDTLIPLAKALDKPLHEIIYIVVPDAPGAEVMRSGGGSGAAVREIEVRVAGWCGAGPDQFDELLGEHIAVEESFVRGRDLIAFRIRGDSMEAGKNPIYSGDTVLVDRSDKGYDTASVVARLTSGGYVCKTLKDDKFGVNLVSANPNYTNGTPPYIPSLDIAEIVGRVVRIIHDSKE